MPLGRTLRPGFVKRGVKGKFLGGTIKQYGNKKGMIKKIRR